MCVRICVHLRVEERDRRSLSQLCVCHHFICAGAAPVPPAQPYNRMMSAYEQRREAPDKSVQVRVCARVVVCMLCGFVHVSFRPSVCVCSWVLLCLRLYVCFFMGVRLCRAGLCVCLCAHTVSLCV